MLAVLDRICRWGSAGQGPKEVLVTRTPHHAYTLRPKHTRRADRTPKSNSHTSNSFTSPTSAQAGPSPVTRDKQDKGHASGGETQASALSKAFFDNMRGPQQAGAGASDKPGDVEAAAGERGVVVAGSKDASRVKGLVNLGNTCYLNSVLQNLLNTAPLRDSLLARGIHGITGEGEVTRSLRALMIRVWAKHDVKEAAIAPRQLLDALAKAEPRYSPKP